MYVMSETALCFELADFVAGHSRTHTRVYARIYRARTFGEIQLPPSATGGQHLESTEPSP